jgi:hypothetical protein
MLAQTLHEFHDAHTLSTAQEEIRELLNKGLAVKPEFLRTLLYRTQTERLTSKQIEHTSLMRVYNSQKTLRALARFAGVPVFPVKRDLVNCTVHIYKGGQDNLPAHYDSPITCGDGMISAVWTVELSGGCNPVLEVMNPETYTFESFDLRENTLSIHFGCKSFHRVPKFGPPNSIRVAFIGFYTIHSSIPPITERVTGVITQSARGLYNKLRIRTPVQFTIREYSVGLLLVVGLMLVCLRSRIHRI